MKKLAVSCAAFFLCLVALTGDALAQAEDDCPCPTPASEDCVAARDRIGELIARAEPGRALEGDDKTTLAAALESLGRTIPKELHGPRYHCFLAAGLDTLGDSRGAAHHAALALRQQAQADDVGSEHRCPLNQERRDKLEKIQTDALRTARQHRLRIGGFAAALSLGLVAGGVGLGLAIHWHDEFETLNSELKAMCPDNACGSLDDVERYHQLQEETEDARRRARIGVGVSAAGFVVAAGAAVALLSVMRRAKETSVPASLRVGPSGSAHSAGLLLRGRF